MYLAIKKNGTNVRTFKKVYKSNGLEKRWHRVYFVHILHSCDTRWAFSFKNINKNTHWPFIRQYYLINLEERT